MGFKNAPANVNTKVEEGEDSGGGGGGDMISRDGRAQHVQGSERWPYPQAVLAVIRGPPPFVVRPRLVQINVTVRCPSSSLLFVVRCVAAL
eukprot:scaffold66907_cov31-Tisochrysis_lutea.AAC.1